MEHLNTVTINHDKHTFSLHQRKGNSLAKKSFGASYRKYYWPFFFSKLEVIARQSTHNRYRRRTKSSTIYWVGFGRTKHSRWLLHSFIPRGVENTALKRASLTMMMMMAETTAKRVTKSVALKMLRLLADVC